MLHLNTNISFHLVLSHSCHRFILVMDWVTRYYTLLCSVNYFWSFLHHFCIFQMGGGPLLHCSIGSRLRCRLFWRLQISSSWSRGTMLLTCNNVGHVLDKVRSSSLTPSRSSMRAWMGTAALTTRPRRRWQRISTPVFRLSSLQEEVSGNFGKILGNRLTESSHANELQQAN